MGLDGRAGPWLDLARLHRCGGHWRAGIVGLQCGSVGLDGGPRLLGLVRRGAERGGFDDLQLEWACEQASCVWWAVMGFEGMTGCSA